MNELTIQSHNFDKAKTQLKKFSEDIPSSMDLESVATHGGLFDWFEHHVTGEELNKLTTQIQKWLILINDLEKKSIKEFGQVYQALEALDKDYIQAIFVAIKAAEKASEQAQKSANEAKKNTLDIERTFEVQKKTVDVLTKFKNQIDAHKHLKDIDEIWSDSQKLKKDVKSINSKIKKQESKFKEGIDQFSGITEKLDELWSDSQELKKDVESINGKIKKQESGINEKYETHIKSLSKKIKILYLLAGISIAVALISIVLNIFGVI